MKPFRAPLAFAALAPLIALGAEQRFMTVDDIGNMAGVRSPQISPDGEWIAYTVTRVDRAKDSNITQVWMVSWDGSKQMQLTQGAKSSSSPLWSPDGRHITFVRSGAGEKEDEETDQVWLMDRRGGEARQLTALTAKLSEYAWSPDSRRLALVLREEEPKPGDADQKGEKRPTPLVIDRYQFKSDEEGYHYRTEQPRIFLYDIDAQALTALTGEKKFEESSPTWSPDGKRIAFVSNRDEDWDRTEYGDIWVAEAWTGAPARKLTEFPGSNEGPLAWSPDGRFIAYLQGSEPRYWLYNQYQLAVVPSAGGAVSFPAPTLDRDASSPRFTVDGRSIEFVVTDDRRQHIARVPANGGAARRLPSGDRVVSDPTATTRAPARTALLSTASDSPPEIYALEAGKLRQLTHHNSDWAAALRLGLVRTIEFKGQDGVDVNGVITQPAGWQAGRKYPTILWIHGGPYGQDGFFFDTEAQLFAAQGYLVVQVNYRGSAGRGADFGRGIFANWGSKDLSDLLAGVDHVIGMGLADPARLGVGGWSQGGILTDFVIANDTRFKAAISGAGVGNELAVYGHDQYVYMYDLEFGPPWEQPERWIKLSQPFFQADRIRTPTLFLGGTADFNVPLVGGEQMYQALRSLQIPTQLIIYPGEHHSISRPSFVRDLYSRYLAWYAKYLGDPRS